MKPRLLTFFLAVPVIAAGLWLGGRAEWVADYALSGQWREDRARQERLHDPAFLPKRLALAKGFRQVALVAPWKICPVGVASITPTLALVCDYRAVYAVDFEAATATELPPPAIVAKWVPTGIFYDAPRARLYVANYHGGDVLVFDWRPGQALALIRRLAFAEMRGPENVAVSTDGQTVAIADYDGNRVIVCDATGVLRWQVQLYNAHGIAIDERFGQVLATGCGTAEIVSYDLATGKLRDRVYGEGWGRGGYLWPVCLTMAPDGARWLSDAHTGKLTRLGEHLEPLASIGGNGPGSALFNMPYAAVALPTGGFLVADTFKGRVVQLDAIGRALIAFNLGSLQQGPTPPAAVPLGITWVDRANPANAMEIDGKLTVPGYGGWNVGGHQWYYTQFGRLGDNVLVTSPQVPIGFVVGHGQRRQVRVGLDFWQP